MIPRSFKGRDLNLPRQVSLPLDLVWGPESFSLLFPNFAGSGGGAAESPLKSESLAVFAHREGCGTILCLPFITVAITQLINLAKRAEMGRFLHKATGMG